MRRSAPGLVTGPFVRESRPPVPEEFRKAMGRAYRTAPSTHQSADRRPQPGHPCPRRCRQDHRHRADPLSHRRRPQAGRGPRRDDRHRLRLPGTRPRNHHLRRRGELLVGRSPDQSDRHPGPCRLLRRGGALAAGARRRDRGVRRRRGRRTAERVGVAAGRPARGASDRLRQQAGPRRGRPRHGGRIDQGPAAHRPAGGPAADRERGGVRRSGGSAAHAGAALGRRRHVRGGAGAR